MRLGPPMAEATKAAAPVSACRHRSRSATPDRSRSVRAAALRPGDHRLPDFAAKLHTGIDRAADVNPSQTHEATLSSARASKNGASRGKR